jgi:hypothetical protein
VEQFLLCSTSLSLSGIVGRCQGNHTSILHLNTAIIRIESLDSDHMVRKDITNTYNSILWEILSRSDQAWWRESVVHAATAICKYHTGCGITGNSISYYLIVILNLAAPIIQPDTGVGWLVVNTIIEVTTGNEISNTNSYRYILLN